jgi:SNF2 family DNA or RNA helicase
VAIGWIIQGDELRYDNGGASRAVSAGEIYKLSRQGPSSHLPQLIYERFPAKLAIRIQNSRGGLPSVDFAAVLHGEALLVSNVLERQSDHVTDGQRWVALEDDALQSVRSALSAARITAQGPLTLGQYLNLVRIAKEHEISLDDKWSGDAHTAADAESDAAEGLPAIRGNLYPYQIKGFRWLSSISEQGLGCILADEMGLGKTLQVITLLAAEKILGRGPNLIVCPATILENWSREIGKFCPQLRVLLHQGAIRTGSAKLFPVVDVVLTSYDTALRDQLLLAELNWNVVVLDEAQNIKNPDAQRSAATKSIPRRVSIAITGTPVENRLEDLWSIADFALPQMLGSRAEFLAHFEDTATDAHRLGPIVSPILLRRRVAEVASDLPPRIDIPQPLKLTPVLAETYERIRRETELEYGLAAGLVSLGRLRMFCAHPCLIVDWPADPKDGWPKYQRVIEILEEIFSVGEKALIFSGYTGIADLLVDDLRKRFGGIYVDWIDGRVNVHERQPKVDKFTEALCPGVLVLKPKAAGTGLNITTANHVIHYNPEWNPAVEDQASARAHRRGQTLPVTVHRLFYVDTVEEVIVDRLSSKRKLAAGAVTATEGDTDVGDVLRALRTSPLSHTAK